MSTLLRQGKDAFRNAKIWMDTIRSQCDLTNYPASLIFYLRGINMRTKILILGLILLAIVSCEDIKNPHSTNPLGLPTVNYFTITHLQGDYFTLSWSTQDATTVEIDQGIGEVPVIGTMEVQIFEPTTYTLTANNERGTRTASCEGVPSTLIEIKITITPEPVVLIYYPDSNTSKTTFTIVLTETIGEVGASFNGEIRSWGGGPPYLCAIFLPLDWRTLEASGTVTYDCDIEVLCRPTEFQAYIVGIDTMGREVQMLWDIPFVFAN